ncbi:MAG: hypothetical protein DMG47_12990 [Acidobacteria bacterium]|nr:MAG: hypothetical protein DMG47_12990 [Acidobacteriota bacterium]
MHAPLRTGLARFFDHRGVYGPHMPSWCWPPPLDSIFLQQFLTEVLQPPFRLSQTVQQGHIRHFSNAGGLRAHRRLAQRIAAANVQQQSAQDLVHGVETAKTRYRTASTRLALPVRREQPQENFPVFIKGIHALRVQKLESRVNSYLSAYGRLFPRHALVELLGISPSAGLVSRLLHRRILTTSLSS